MTVHHIVQLQIIHLCNWKDNSTDGLHIHPSNCLAAFYKFPDVSNYVIYKETPFKCWSIFDLNRPQWSSLLSIDILKVSLIYRIPINSYNFFKKNCNINWKTRAKTQLLEINVPYSEYKQLSMFETTIHMACPMLMFFPFDHTKKQWSCKYLINLKWAIWPNRSWCRGVPKS